MVLTFRVKWASVLDYKLLSNIADYVTFDTNSKLHIYRLNPVKAARVGLDETLRILGRVGTYLPSSIRDLISELSRVGADAYLTLESPDIVIYAGSREVVERLKGLGLVRRDARSGTYRLRPKDLHQVLEILRKWGLNFFLGFSIDYGLTFTPKLKLKLRDYQEEAYRAWVTSGYRGVIVMPVAAGKTAVALRAIEELRVRTLVLVPTLDLLNQWRENIIKYLDVPPGKVGIFGGGRRDVRELTIMTYDSAYINLDKYTVEFGLVIADECHHAVSTNYRKALEFITAPYRLGLTATPFRSDGLHKYYSEVLGPIIYSLSSEPLKERGYLAKHREERIYITLSSEELEEYRRLMEVYLDYCRRKFPEIKDPRLRFRKVLELASKDPEAREALRAKHRARKIALSTERKIGVVEELLKKYANEKVLIFSRYTDIIREISRRFLIPRILHDTPKDERREYLRLFREGRIRVLATAMALDEGVDVPDASVAIVISGTGSHREYVQRLGRILRPKEREAVLIELITRRTLEPSLARRRRRFEVFLDEE